jgi:hypothetical protein
VITPSDWVSTTDAAGLADVSRFWMQKLCQQGKIEAVFVAGQWLVSRKAAEGFERHPSAGRPRNQKPAPRVSKPGRRKPV